MNTESRDERLKRIREELREAQRPQRYPPRAGWDDVDFLLSLLDSQAASSKGWCEQCMKVVVIDVGPDGHVRPEHDPSCDGSCASCPVPILCGPVHSINELVATRMREACVAAIRSVRHKSEPDESRWNAALYHAETRVESLTLDQVEQKEDAKEIV